ncbi:MAG TPA: hypothetical protein V6C72_11140 [Chroococcales cyanobacterium]
MFSGTAKIYLIVLVVILQIGLAAFVTWSALREPPHKVAETHEHHSEPNTKNEPGGLKSIYKQVLLNAQEIDASEWPVEPEFFHYLTERRSKVINFFKASRKANDSVVSYLKGMAVHHLALVDCRITTDCLKDIAGISGLEYLEINRLAADPQDWQVILQNHELQFLSAKDCNLDDSCVRFIGTHPYRLLELRGNPQISDDGVASLKPGALEMVGLGNNHTISDASAQSLSKFPTLDTIDLTQTNVGDSGLLALADMPNLRILNLRESQVSDSGLSRFKPHKKMRKLILFGCKKVTPKCIKEFQAAHPGCFVEMYTNGVHH